jgi:hypothetical protein
MQSRFCTVLVYGGSDTIFLKAMNSTSKNNGLSARRKSIEKNNKNVFTVNGFLRRSTLLTLLAALSLTMSSCDKKAKDQHLADAKKDRTVIVKDSLDKPKVNIKVNRHYDDKGNLVGFDSTYSSFYSNAKGDTLKMDSLMNNFDRYFYKNHSSLFDRQFNSLFFNDSMRYPDFFHNDFFMKRYELNDQYLRGMMHDMDSIKNDFYTNRSKKEGNSENL